MAAPLSTITTPSRIAGKGFAQVVNRGLQLGKTLAIDPLGAIQVIVHIPPYTAGLGRHLGRVFQPAAQAQQLEQPDRALQRHHQGDSQEGVADKPADTGRKRDQQCQPAQFEQPAAEQFHRPGTPRAEKR